MADEADHNSQEHVAKEIARLFEKCAKAHGLECKESQVSPTDSSSSDANFPRYLSYSYDDSSAAPRKIFWRPPPKQLTVKLEIKALKNADEGVAKQVVEDFALLLRSNSINIFDTKRVKKEGVPAVVSRLFSEKECYEFKLPDTNKIVNRIQAACLKRDEKTLKQVVNAVMTLLTNGVTRFIKDGGYPEGEDVRLAYKSGLPSAWEEQVEREVGYQGAPEREVNDATRQQLRANGDAAEILKPLAELFSDRTRGSAQGSSLSR